VTILKPGCQGCLSPHEWQHDEDCPGRSLAAGHRHAKDLSGRSLYVGDQVVAMVRHRSGSSSYNHSLVLATVMAVLPKSVRITYQEPSYGRWSPSEAQGNVPDNRLVKVTKWRP
jgi:hypothetical protein